MTETLLDIFFSAVFHKLLWGNNFQKAIEVSYRLGG